MDRRFRLLAELPWFLLYWRHISPIDKAVILAGYKVILDELEPILRSVSSLPEDVPDPAPIPWAPIDKPYLRSFLESQNLDPDDPTRVIPITIPPDSSSFEGFLWLFSQTDLVRYLTDADVGAAGGLPLFDLAIDLAQTFWRISTGSDKPVDPIIEGIDWLMLRFAEWGIFPPIREIADAIEDPASWSIPDTLISAADARPGLASLVDAIQRARELMTSLDKAALRSLVLSHFGAVIEAL